ncbi:cingulin [Megalops cyprinoides]|uniref:cingulin n=1 Tax=Megalops cyprinoides TaxID=118141 RepID=UPI001864F7ED|nr:cingulin [Megalops cyprinoides]
MSTPSSERQTPLDYGVQIRFIKDLHDTGGGIPVGARGAGKGTSSSHSSKYGVAVRVQGIAGQPYVVLKEGEKGDSYGVQLKSEPRSTSSPQAYNSLPRRREEGRGPDSYTATGEHSSLRRAQSQGSLLERETGEDYGGHLRRPPGDGRSGSYGNLDGGIGIGGERERGSVEPQPYQAGMNGSLGTGGGREASHYTSVESFPDPPPPMTSAEEPAQVIDTNSLAPINRLISKFDGGSPSGPARGPSGARVRMNSEERKRSRSLDARDNAPEMAVSPSLPSSSPNPYSSPPSSTTSSYSSLGRSSGSVAKVVALPAPTPACTWAAGRFVTREQLPVTQTETQVPPDLLMDQGQSSEFMTEEERTKHIIYSILRMGTNESESATKHKVSLVFEKIQGLRASEGASEAWRTEKRDLEMRLAGLQSALEEERRSSQMASTDQTLKAELEDCLDENLQLQEQLDRKKTELHQTHSELTQLRMDRESAEARVRELEDRLTGLQEELRKESDGRAQSDSLQTDLMSVRAELAEAAMLRQRQEETLRQRERELTALKGALKDEVATHDREIEALREQYSQDMERLRSSMEQVSQSQQQIEAERQRVNASMRSMQQQLEDCREEGGHWREQFQSTREELRTTKQELLQARLEKEEFEEGLKELQERLNTVKEQIPDPSHTSALTEDLQNCRADLKLAQSQLDKLRLDFDKRGMELISVKKSNQEREEELKYEIGRLKDQSRKDKEELAKALGKVKQLPDPSKVQELQQELLQARGEAERLRGGLAGTEQELQTYREQLASAQSELQVHRDSQKDLEEANTRIREKIARLEAHLQSSASQSMEMEQALEEQNRSLRVQLEESRRAATRLGQEREELSRRLEEREREREALRRSITELEDQKRVLDRTLDKTNKEMEQLSAESRQSVQALQAQLEDHRERSKREQQEAQRQGKERLAELERMQASWRSLQEEVSRLKKELLACCEERDNAQLDKELLTNRLKHVEGELEAQRGSHTDRSREIRSLEDKVKHLEMELDEERNSVELLTDRITRSRDQIDQLRSELMQEKSSKQDLELDKNALERQMKELKARMAEMEGHSRSSAGVSQLEGKVLELEERLHSEEREKNSVVATQRRLERKLKELNITLDEERQQHSEQRDQLTLRVKALKRQVDEGEGEVERLEGLRRKALRDMEEQLELKEALQARVAALEAELKRKVQQTRHPALDSSALSSEDEEDEEGYYDPSSITSILTEGNLQTSSC